MKNIRKITYMTHMFIATLLLLLAGPAHPYNDKVIISNFAEYAADITHHSNQILSCRDKLIERADVVADKNQDYYYLGALKDINQTRSTLIWQAELIGASSLIKKSKKADYYKHLKGLLNVQARETLRVTFVIKGYASNIKDEQAKLLINQCIGSITEASRIINIKVVSAL